MGSSYGLRTGYEWVGKVVDPEVVGRMEVTMMKTHRTKFSKNKQEGKEERKLVVDWEVGSEKKVLTMHV